MEASSQASPVKLPLLRLVFADVIEAQVAPESMDLCVRNRSRAPPQSCYCWGSGGEGFN